MKKDKKPTPECCGKKMILTIERQILICHSCDKWEFANGDEEESV